MASSYINLRCKRFIWSIFRWNVRSSVLSIFNCFASSVIILQIQDLTKNGEYLNDQILPPPTQPRGFIVICTEMSSQSYFGILANIGTYSHISSAVAHYQQSCDISHCHLQSPQGSPYQQVNKGELEKHPTKLVVMEESLEHTIVEWLAASYEMLLEILHALV